MDDHVASRQTDTQTCISTNDNTLTHRAQMTILLTDRQTDTQTCISTDNTLTHRAQMTILLTDRQTHRHVSVLTTP